MEEIKELIVEENRPEHISKHKVSIKEVEDVLSGNYVWIKAKLGRWMVLGKTKKGKFLAIIVGERKKKGVFGLVTARVANKKERNFYNEFSLQVKGDENDKD